MKLCGSYLHLPRSFELKHALPVRQIPVRYFEVMHLQSVL